MTSDLEVLDRLLRKERVSKESREQLGQVLSANIISPSAVSALFNSVLLRLDLKECPSMETAATDGKSLHYNPEFVASLSPEQLEWLLDHEAMHVGLAHPARMNFCEDHELANIAADLVVNQILKEAGLTRPPPGVLFPGQGEYKDIEPGLDLETTYERLLKRKQAQQQPEPEEEEDEGEEDNSGGEEGGEGEGDGDGENPADGQAGGGDNGDGQGGQGESPTCPDPGRCGGVMKAGDGSPAAAADQEAEAQIVMAEAEAIAATMGNLPAALQKLLERRKQKPQDWRARLRDWLTRRANNRLGWDRPKSWGISRGLYLPGKTGRTLGEIVLVIDTSGSCWGEPLKWFANEVQAVAEEFNTPLVIGYCDCGDVQEQLWDPEEGKDLELLAHGGGGTSHKPVFEWLEREHAEARGVICFTDLCTSFPDKPPAVDTLWAAVGGWSVGVPFGEVIRLDAP